jgi:hypothetical protein
MKWYKVPGYLTEVTKDGYVRHSITKKIKNQYTNKDGYKLAAVRKGNRKYLELIHVLVALTFIGPKPSSKHEVNHKDLDKANNYYKNLEWCTHRKNMQHASKNGALCGTQGEKNGNSKLTEEQVIDIRFLRSLNLYTREDLSKAFKVSIP